MPAGITSSDSMFSVRETPWHGLGAVLDRPPATIAEAIQASGLGWRVEREPIAVDRGDAATIDDWWEPRCDEIPGYYATVRQDTRAVLGIVGERYRIYLQSGVIGSRRGEAAVIAAAAEGWLSSTSDNSMAARLLEAGEVGRHDGRGARVVVDRGA